MRGERPKYSDEELAAAPENFVELMHACWSTYEDERPTFKTCQKRLHTILNNHRRQQQQNGDKETNRMQMRRKITAEMKSIELEQKEINAMRKSIQLEQTKLEMLKGTSNHSL